MRLPFAAMNLQPWARAAGALLLPALGVALLALHPVAAQKVQEIRATTVYHKTPALALAPKYATYSVVYDLGNTTLSTPNRPNLQGLKFQKEGGDVVLQLTLKNLFVTGRKLQASTSRNGVYSGYYAVTYTVDCGYEVRDAKTNEVLASYRKDNGVLYSRTFSVPADLENYMSNAFIDDKGREMLDGICRRADFALNPHDFPVTLTLATVEGAAPSYAGISKAAQDLKHLLETSSNTAPDRAQVAALATIWQQQLSNVDWANKKSEINRKVGSALLRNLCATALLTEDYPKLGSWSSDFTNHNTGFFESMPASFVTTTAYGGFTSMAPYSTTVNNQLETRQQVYFDELAADVLPKK